MYYRAYKTDPAGRFLSHRLGELSRDFTIGRLDGSENVASKMNLRSFGLYRDYSNSLTLAKVGVL